MEMTLASKDTNEDTFISNFMQNAYPSYIKIEVYNCKEEDEQSGNSINLKGIYSQDPLTL
jgi:hypothetical protein